MQHTFQLNTDNLTDFNEIVDEINL
jgi:hypothetical protein